MKIALINKYNKWYFNIINNAKNQSRVKSKFVYYESHHKNPRKKREVILCV